MERLCPWIGDGVMAVRDVVQAAAGVGGGAEYVEDVFSTYLYTGDGTARSINNGIDLAGEGGLVWLKNRGTTSNHSLHDTERTPSYQLVSNSTAVEDTLYGDLSSFNSDGFSIGTSGGGNNIVGNIASWTFRKAPKFFDVVTYTGNGGNMTIPHDLGVTPGMIIVKRTDSTSYWRVHHRSVDIGKQLYLNETYGQDSGSQAWNNTLPTDTAFTVGLQNTDIGGTFVAYLFAHDAGGFGDDGEQNVISCGSYTGNSSSLPNTISLGFEPQWVMVKKSNGTSDWAIWDIMRGMSLSSNAEALEPNTSDAESTTGNIIVYPTADGFEFNDASDFANINGGSYIYIAIRRPMKTPESGTEVFAPVAYTGNAQAGRVISAGFPVDWTFITQRAGSNKYSTTRLTSPAIMRTNATSAEAIDTNRFTGVASNTGTIVGTDTDTNATNYAYINWAFKRAPGFFDVVAYTGTGSGYPQTPHNLGVTPELVIFKNRSSAGDWWTWTSYYDDQGGYALALNKEANNGSGLWANVFFSATTLGQTGALNTASNNYIAYLFATLAGVSKVGGYTGNGTNQTIDCGFSAGARFVLIKRTGQSVDGDWNVFDTTRGIVAGNDPRLELNTTNAEDTGNDGVDPSSSGFIVNYVANDRDDVNISGATYIFLAIA